MDVLRVWTVAAGVSFILGCSSGQSADPPGGAAASAAAPPPPTVFDPLTQQLQKAKGVQDTADANAEAQRRAVEQQERGDDPPQH